MTSVIIPVYNLARYITAALDSVRAQTNPDWEVIVVDDCSTDGSRHVVQTYIEQTRDPRIRLIWPEKNGGVSAARNLGASHSRGEWLAFLDGDDMYEPDFLAAMRASAEATGAAITHCRAYFWEEGRGAVGEYGPGPTDVQHFPGSLYTWNFIIPSVMLLRREAWLRVGLFDTTPEMQHVEDWDWNLRAVQGGESFGYLPRVLTRWRQHPGNATSRKAAMREKCLLVLDRHAHISNYRSQILNGRLWILHDLAELAAADNPLQALRYRWTAWKLRPLDRLLLGRMLKAVPAACMAR
jgi:glycosyltransferase involved in cell wall biosynthesis